MAKLEKNQQIIDEIKTVIQLIDKENLVSRQHSSTSQKEALKCLNEINKRWWEVKELFEKEKDQSFIRNWIKRNVVSGDFNVRARADRVLADVRRLHGNLTADLGEGRSGYFEGSE